MIKGVMQEHKLYHDGNEISLERSLKVMNHSPTGFSWGYGGSGPAQSALALLLHFGATDQEALRWYQSLKKELIAPLRGEDGQPLYTFEMEDGKITEWIESRRLFQREFPEE